MDPIAAAIERLRAEKDSETRGTEAGWLGEHGDARAFEVLERAVLEDDGTWYEEGGFADRINSVADVALEALAKLSTRVASTSADDERRRALLATSAGYGHALDLLFRSLRPSVNALLDEAAERGDASLRARAITIRDGLDAAVEHPDEDVRLAALSRNPDGTSLYAYAMKRLPREPSARVKRAIFDVWLRVERDEYRVHSGVARMFFALDDADVRRTMARIVLERKINPPQDAAALKEIANEVLGVSKPKEAKRDERSKMIAEAVREAEASGKEPFDWEMFRMSGCRPHGEDEHVFDYYVMKSEMRTMAEYIAHRKEMDPWD